jgi:hypothetical protein
MDKVHRPDHLKLVQPEPAGGDPKVTELRQGQPGKFVTRQVDLKFLSSTAGTLVLFPSLFKVEPVWESTVDTTIIECLARLAPPEPAKVIVQKNRVPYAIAGVLKEAETINKLRAERIAAGLPTIGKQRSSGHIASLGPLLILDDDGDVFARIPKLRARGWFAMVYSSWSYMFEKTNAGPEPRGRVVLLLNRAITPGEYLLAWDAINEVLGGGFDESGQSIALCYGIHARRSDDAPFRKEFVAGGVIDADALIELGRSLQPEKPQYEPAASKGTHKHRGLAEDIERTKLMGAARPPDEYDDWYPAAAAFKREYPNDEERAFLLFDAWSSCSSKYEGPDDTRKKFDQVPAQYEGHAIEVVVGMLYARAKRRALKVLKTLYPLHPGEIVPIAEEFKKLNLGPLFGNPDAAPQKGDEPIELGGIKPEDGLIALEFLLFCYGEKAIEGMPIPPAVLEKAQEATEARRLRIDLNGRVTHDWEGRTDIFTNTQSLAETIVDAGAELYRVDNLLMRLATPISDAATADRLRKLHKYKGEPGAPGDPALSKGLRLSPILPSDIEALRAIISKHVAAVKRENIGTEEEPEWQTKATSYQFKANTSTESGPDANVLKDLLKREIPNRVPEIVGIITAPVMPNLPSTPEDLLRAEADYIVTKPGFDPASGLFLAPIGTIIPVPDNPTRGDVDAAIDLLQQPWVDMPFASPAEGFNAEVSRSAAVFSSFVAANRRVLEIAPPVAFSSPGGGMSSGKTLSSKLVGIVATGESPIPLSLSTDFNEQKKELITYYVVGSACMLIDNVAIGSRLDSAFLASGITSDHVRGRMLGHNKEINASTRTMITINGVSLNMAGDLASRTLFCKLNTGLERPEDRSVKNFQIPDLIGWTIEHYQHLVAAVHTVVRAYIQTYRQCGGTPPEVEARRRETGADLGTRFPQVEVLRDAFLWAAPGSSDPFLGFQASTRNSSTNDNAITVLHLIDKVMVELAGETHTPSWISKYPSNYGAQITTAKSLQQAFVVGGYPDKARALAWLEKLDARWRHINPEQRDEALPRAFFRMRTAMLTFCGRRAVRAGRVSYTAAEILRKVDGNDIGSRFEAGSAFATLRGATHTKGHTHRELDPSYLGTWLHNNLVERPLQGLVMRCRKDRKGVSHFWIEWNESYLAKWRNIMKSLGKIK